MGLYAILAITSCNRFLNDLSVSHMVVEEFGPLLYSVTSVHWCLWAFIFVQLS